MKLPTDDGTGVNRICLGGHVPTQLLALKKFLERDSTDSSQGLILGMEPTLKLWKLYPEITYIYILQPYLLHFTLNTTPPPGRVSSPNRAAAVAIA